MRYEPTILGAPVTFGAHVLSVVSCQLSVVSKQVKLYPLLIRIRCRIVSQLCSAEKTGVGITVAATMDALVRL